MIKENTRPPESYRPILRSFLPQESNLAFIYRLLTHSSEGNCAATYPSANLSPEVLSTFILWTVCFDLSHETDGWDFLFVLYPLLFGVLTAFVRLLKQQNRWNRTRTDKNRLAICRLYQLGYSHNDDQARQTVAMVFKTKQPFCSSVFFILGGRTNHPEDMVCSFRVPAI